MQFIDNPGGLPEPTDQPIFSINYPHMIRVARKLTEQKVWALIKEAYLTGNISPKIKRVLIRIPEKGSAPLSRRSK